MLLSSAVLWFVYLRYLVYLGVLAMLLFFFRCYWLYPCVWLCLVVGVWCWFFLSFVCGGGHLVASGWTLYMMHIWIKMHGPTNIYIKKWWVSFLLWMFCGSRCCAGVRRRSTQRRAVAVPAAIAPPSLLRRIRCLLPPRAIWRVRARSTGGRSWRELCRPTVCSGYRRCTAIRTHCLRYRPGPTAMWWRNYDFSKQDKSRFE